MHMQEQLPSFCIGCTACLGYMDAQDDVSFSDANVFGFPKRIWGDFANEEAVLEVLGEAEVRARLQVHERKIIEEQPAPSALECAEYLLQLELVGEVREQMIREGREVQQEVNVELAEMAELMSDEEMCQSSEDHRLSVLAYEEDWAKTMLEVRKTDTPLDFRDCVVMRLLQEDRRERDRQRLATRTLRIRARTERARRERKHFFDRQQKSVQKLHQAGLRADVDELRLAKKSSLRGGC